VLLGKAPTDPCSSCNALRGAGVKGVYQGKPACLAEWLRQTVRCVPHSAAVRVHFRDLIAYFDPLLLLVHAEMVALSRTVSLLRAFFLFRTPILVCLYFCSFLRISHCLFVVAYGVACTLLIVTLECWCNTPFFLCVY